MAISVGEGFVSSDRVDGGTAGRQLVQDALDDGGLDDADFGILFCSTAFDLEPFITGIEDALSGTDADWVGCTTAGELSKNGATDAGAVLVLVDSDELSFNVGLSEDVPDGPESAGNTAATRATSDWKEDNDDENRVLFPLVTGQTFSDDDHAFDVLQGIVKAVPDVPMTGGTAGDYRIKATYQFFNGDIYEDAAIVTAISSPYPILTGMDHGMHEKVASGVVSSADGNVIEEINGEPAAEFYADAIDTSAWKLKLPILPRAARHPGMILHYLRLWLAGDTSITAQRVFRYSLRHTMALEMAKDQFRIVEPQSVTRDNGLVMKTPVQENQAIHVVHGEHDDIVEAVSTAFSDVDDDAEHTAVFGVFADCMMRRILLDQADRDRELTALQERFDCPMIGFYSHGEIGGSSGQFCTYQSQSVSGFVVTGPTDDGSAE